MKTTFAFLAAASLGFSLLACSDKGSGASSGGEGGEGGAWGSSSGSGGSSQGGGSQSSSSTGQGGGSQSSSSSSSTGQGGSSADPFEQFRQACVDTINAHRATKGLPPLARWKEAEPCVDQQANDDAMTGQAHGAWSSGKYPSCNGSGQNECPGWGAEGTTGCLDSMWSEKDQAGCSGCDACADAYNPSCPNCDFYGQTTGDVCGHYVNMSAKYHSKVACGYSTQGGWIAINFQ